MLYEFPKRFARHAHADDKREALDQMCDEINAMGYGLTLGIHSRLDEVRIRIMARIKAGNIYFNRNQIGAVVGVQPFGGRGLSGITPRWPPMPRDRRGAIISGWQ